MKISRNGVSLLGVVKINKTAKCQPAETPHSTRETLLLRNCGISKLQSAITQFNCDSFCRLNNYELCHRFLRPRANEDEIATANSWSKKSLLLWLRLDEKSFVKRKMKKVVSAFLLAANVCSVKLNDSFESEEMKREFSFELKLLRHFTLRDASLARRRFSFNFHHCWLLPRNETLSRREVNCF